MKLLSLTLGLLASLPTIQALTPATTNNDFQSPPNESRLKFRYWLPDASINTSTLQSNIHSSTSIGSGGIELVPLYNYGASLAPPPEGADWATYGFGTPAFVDVFKSALKAARDEGVTFDFAIGPSQGQGVPSDVHDEGLHWDLAPFNATIPRNGSFSGKIPGWGTGHLVSLISAEVLSESTIHNPASSTFSTPATTSKRLVLRSHSLVDQTAKVSSNGSVNLHFNSTTNPVKLFAYYQYQDLVKNLDIQTNTTGTIFDNGSYTVDHFSSRGAETVIDFWEKYILNDTETRSLLEEVGRFAWEDSIEIESNISWTPSLPGLFEKETGYDLRPYLPLIQFGNNNPGTQPSYPGDIKCVLDTDDVGAGVVNDYRRVLGKGYHSYLNALHNWTESLGLAYSAQISYNLPLDMSSSIGLVTSPECESLAFKNNTDGYRQFSGPAHLSSKSLISNEMGGDLRQAFKLTITHLLSQINAAFAGGVNQVILHGQTYTGNYYDTTWPGYTAFFMLFSDSYSEKQPAWDATYPGMIGYVSRVQWILQTGVQKSDVLFLNKVSVTDPVFHTLYQGQDLVGAGYAYGYASPENLRGQSVEGGVLAGGGPGYRALVVMSEQNVTLDAVKQLQRFADDGLPIILAGGLPGFYPTGNSTKGKDAVTSALHTLQSHENVHSVATNQIASKLSSLSIPPRVSVQTNGTWYPVFRADNETSTDYVFLYSTSPTKTKGSITVQTTKTPYIFNAWSGVRSPVLNYQVTGHDSIRIPVSLAAEQSVIFAFGDELKNEIDTPRTHAMSLPDEVVGYEYSSSAGLSLHILSQSSSTSSNTKNETINLSNGKTHTISHNSFTPHTTAITLSNWTLHAEHWAAPSSLSAAHIQARKYNTTHSIQGSSIPSWLEIEGLKNVSGVGFYSTSFTWPHSHGTQNETSNGQGSKMEMGAYISLPVSTHGLKLSINGQEVPGIDFTHPLIDISSCLVSGTNKVDVIVPTVMWNYIRSLYNAIEIAGSDPLLGTTGSLPERVETGLIGVVRVLPYSVEHIEL